MPFSGPKLPLWIKPLRAAASLRFRWTSVPVCRALSHALGESTDHPPRVTAYAALKIRQGLLAASFVALPFVEKDRQRSTQGEETR